MMILREKVKEANKTSGHEDIGWGRSWRVNWAPWVSTQLMFLEALSDHVHKNNVKISDPELRGVIDAQRCSIESGFRA